MIIPFFIKPQKKAIEQEMERYAGKFKCLGAKPSAAAKDTCKSLHAAMLVYEAKTETMKGFIKSFIPTTTEFRSRKRASFFFYELKMQLRESYLDALTEKTDAPKRIPLKKSEVLDSHTPKKKILCTNEQAPYPFFSQPRPTIEVVDRVKTIGLYR